MAEYTCCSSVAFERPYENTFTCTFTPPPLALWQSRRYTTGLGLPLSRALAKSGKGWLGLEDQAINEDSAEQVVAAPRADGEAGEGGEPPVAL
jgi:hypothetical protein